MYDLMNPNPAVKVEFPLGASSTVESVVVNGQDGEYVRGAYGAGDTWDATAPAQTLSWSVMRVFCTSSAPTSRASVSLERTCWP